MATMTRAAKTEQAEARAQLRDIMPPGTTVYTNLRHVSRSGMMRHITVHTVTPDGLHDWSWLVARALGYTTDSDNGGLKVTGCGMDMGFSLVHGLSYALHGMTDQDGYDRKGSGSRNAVQDVTAGYTLRHRWV